MADTVRRLLLTNALLSLEKIITVRNNTNDDGSIILSIIIRSYIMYERI